MPGKTSGSVEGDLARAFKHERKKEPAAEEPKKKRAAEVLTEEETPSASKKLTDEPKFLSDEGPKPGPTKLSADDFDFKKDKKK